MSAIDWLKMLLEKADSDPQIGGSLKNFIDTAREAGVPYDEKATTIKGIVELPKRTKWEPITDFRGDVFFPDSIRNKMDFPLEDESKRNELLEALNKLIKAVNAEPAPFYAILLMDGDNMGKLLFQYPKGKVSSALANFTGKVCGIVEEDHDGKLIYAGGDDVFALLPLSTALYCAKALREAYIGAFAAEVPEIRENREGTISAGIVYAHMNTALQAIVRDVHTLLDKTAKEKIGRDAFAVRVWKGGGPILTFGKKWDEDKNDCVRKIMELKEYLVNGKYAHGFFYRFEELIPVLKALDPDGRVKLLIAEYLKSRGNLGLPEDPAGRRKEAKERIKRLITLSTQDGELTPDGVFFVRFLAQKEIKSNV
jgi:CRISPR-associated protein Cmr2